MSRSQFFQIALKAVKEAEKVINSHFSGDINVELKANRSPVTIADQQAEQIIRKIIIDAYPEHRILGEEDGQNNNNSPFLWIIDPIDGTKNFMRKVPLFATQLALMKDKEVILGISNAPQIGELMHAEKGKGAYLNGRMVHVSETREVSNSYLSFGGLGYFHRNKELDQLVNLENDTLSHRGFGDFWSYHLLAQGKIDIMIEAETKIWDIAAVSLIVQEAGGKTTDISGQPIDENTTSIIATNGLLHDKVADYFV